MNVVLEGREHDVKHKLLTEELASELAANLPPRLQLHTHWKLKYSLEQHGASLRTLYERAAPDLGDKQQHGYLLVLEDKLGCLLGVYVNEPMLPTSGGHFTGNSDCFLWRQPRGANARAYKYTGSNDFIMFNTHGFISWGGGDGHYGLWVDDDINQAVSYAVPTFDNEELSAQGPKFQVVSAELWQI